jgi:DNA polymerase III delta subunit
MRDFVVNIHLRQLKNKSLADLDKVINMCAETDHNIKNGKTEPWAALDMLMATLIS